MKLTKQQFELVLQEIEQTSLAYKDEANFEDDVNS